jgi:hypothetical protein
LINTQGYIVEVEGQTRYFKTTAITFDGIKKLLKNPKIDGFVSIVRGRDNFEIYCGPVDKARSKFGL